MTTIESAERISENPYASPRGFDELDGKTRSDLRHAWKFVVLGIPIVFGSITILITDPDVFPVPIVLTLLCAPVYLRYFLYRWKRPHARCWYDATGQESGIGGTVRVRT